jgi:hypothetical protein
MPDDRELKTQTEVGVAPSQEPFATIDDALHKAQELTSLLGRLGGYKHPLAVRRGRGREVNDMATSEESQQLNGAGRTYFFDIKRTRDDKPYGVITESRKAREGETFERQSVNVFPEDAAAFAKAVAQMAKHLS